MSIDVQPGTKVQVKVTLDPTNEAARKTLSRVFGRDPVNIKGRQFRRKLRTASMDGRQRGGRIWMVRPKAPRLCQPKKGDSCNVFATSSILNDLRSVSRFVEVAKA